jgi:prepilin-type N-terminal cleavage/methylation domain-containing protein
VTPVVPSPQIQRGFTLVETMIVVLVLSVAALGIAGLIGNVFKQQSDVDATQVRTQLLTECAEQILAVRKYQKDGFATVIQGATYGTNACGGIPPLTGYAVASVTITDTYAHAACTVSTNCKLVEITQDGGTALTFLLVDY